MTIDNRRDSKEKSVCIHAGWLIDGTGSQPQTDVLIHIRKGRFQDIVAAKGREEGIENIVDLRQATVIPGLVDCHIHLAISGTENLQARQEQLEMAYETAVIGLQRRLNAHFRYGIVAIRDGGDRHDFTLRYRQEQMWVGNKFEAFRCAGHTWRKPGRYGKMIAKATAGARVPSAVTHRRGDHIKVLNSGVNSLTEYGKETAPQFTVSEMNRIVRAAVDLNQPVMVHANGSNPVKMAVDAGCASIEHGYFMGKENLKRMADKKTFWVPTVAPMAAYHAILPMATKKASIAGRMLDHQLEQLYRARQEGVRVAVGTDAGSIGVHHGVSVYQEIRLLMAAGYRIHEAVQCASTKGALLLGFDMVRPFEKGNPAVFLVIDGPPAQLRENCLQVRPYRKEGFQPAASVRTDFRRQ